MQGNIQEREKIMGAELKVLQLCDVLGYFVEYKNIEPNRKFYVHIQEGSRIKGIYKAIYNVSTSF